jgi:hypothetical protein
MSAISASRTHRSAHPHKHIGTHRYTPKTVDEAERFVGAGSGPRPRQHAPTLPNWLHRYQSASAAVTVQPARPRLDTGS